MGTRRRKSPEMQRRRNSLQLKLIPECLRQLPERIVLAADMTKTTSGIGRIVAAVACAYAGNLSPMHADLAGAKNGIAERFVPDQDRGRLIEVEHVSRYLWAAQAARERSVSMPAAAPPTAAGCWRQAGAREVVGVDIAGAVLEAVAPTMPDRSACGQRPAQLSFGDDRLSSSSASR